MVSEILVDKGTDVNPGTPLIKLSSIGKNEIEISLSFNEIDLIKTGTKVKIIYLDQELKGTISSISPIADANLNYRTKISVDSQINISGNIAKIIIPVELEKKLIKLSLIKVTSEKQGEISTFVDGKIVKYLITLGKFYGDKVEVLSCVNLKDKECNNLEIIKNDISKYDESKFNIKIKNKK
ncbi:MAG: HlyD family efflux transporter periplasmic adaptor subunit [Candidatus Gracilibacteria bacterium]|nr:HlyD family efflux transporter periplasmic adaptor subunit [Candidatus Gracilibacteria bacterium]